MNSGIIFSRELGSKVRDLRKDAQKTLSEVASAVGVTSSFLSQFENGKVSPSLETLFKIAEVLGKNPAFFFPNGDLYKKNSPVIIQDPSTVSSYEELFPGTPERIMKPVIIRLGCDGEVKKKILADGGEIFANVLAGRLEVVCMKEGRAPNIAGKGYEIFWYSEKFVLTSGESFYYSCERPEKVRNPFKEEAKILWIAGRKIQSRD